MIKVSIIVPVYNVEKYIDKCLKTLVNQTLKEIEVIVVNDGTKDNSQKIIDKYQKKYPQIIKSYIKENGGLSDARNYGLKYAKGKYIAFLDSDDYVELDMYEKMYNKAISMDFDIVVCNINYIYPNKIVKCSSKVKNDISIKEKVTNKMLDIYPAAWNKIYKRELIQNKIEFKKGIWYEDVEFLYRLFPSINTIGVIKEYLINYVQREGAITKTFDDRLYNYIDNWNGIIEYYKKNNMYKMYHDELEYCYIRYIYGTFIKQCLNYSSKEEYEKAVDSAIKNVKEKFNKYKKNRYFYKNSKGYYLLLFNKRIAKIMYSLKHR